MYIKRDITDLLQNSHTPVQLLIGPRQCGKSTLLSSISGTEFIDITFDDLHLRRLANEDPKLFLEQFKSPVLLDEVQYVPNLFPEIKRRIDELKKQRLKDSKNIAIVFRMTGSNQILMDKNIKESLAGRASFFYLNTLSVHEILNSRPNTKIIDILFKGGWPELYLEQDIATTQYLNDYIRSYIEKDIAMSAGLQKIEAFNTTLGLLAARTGMLLDYTNIARDSGIKAVTIKEWIGILKRAALVYTLQPYSNNLNKRLTKTPKIYFLDTGIATRLQGWQEARPMLNSPQAGGLFETLVLAEIVKFIQNYNKDWKINLWRTKDGEEIDFLITKSNGEVIAIDAKISMHKARAAKLPQGFKTLFPNVSKLIIVTFGGDTIHLNQECTSLPISELHNTLMQLATKPTSAQSSK